MPPLGGINASALEDQWGRGVVMVLSRPCDGLGYGQGTGFAVDARTIVTNWHVVAEDNENPESPIDPHPWIMTYNRGWRRGTVVGASASPDIAVIRLDDAESDVAQSLRWSDNMPTEGQHLAVLGFPGIEGGEFNLVVGTASRVDDTTQSIPSFELIRALSGRTGPGNSGGPIVDPSGAVVGIHTWGTYDRSHWFGQDSTVARRAVEDILASPEEAATACGADGPERMSLSYTARLGTFASPSEAWSRSDLLGDAGPEGAVITSVNSSDWVPFLLSDYPSVLMAGPFSTREQATAAVSLYQAAIDAAGQTDTFSVGVMPTQVFDDALVEEELEGCMESTSTYAVVHGVTENDPLKLRAGPTTKAAVIGELRNGEELMVGTDVPVEADGLTWIPVSTLSDVDPQCGWVAQRYTEALEGD